MKKVTKNKLSNENNPHPWNDDKKIEKKVINKPILFGHKGTKSRRIHEVYFSVFILLRVPLCHCVFVVKSYTIKIFDYVLFHWASEQEAYLSTIFKSNRNKYLFRFLSIFFLLLFPSILSAQSSHFFTQQGLLHYELKEYDESIHHFEMALQYPNPQRDLYTYIVSSSLLNGEIENAIRWAGEGLDEYPDFLRLKVMKGEALIQADVRKAIPVFEEIWEELKRSDFGQIDGIQTEAIEQYISRLYQQLAAESFEQGDLWSAAGSFQRASKFDQKNVHVHNNLAYIFIQLEEWEKADEVVKSGLKRFPQSENLLLMQAQIHEQFEYSDELLHTLKTLYETDPSNMNRAVMYGRALLNSNRANDANTFFRDKLETYPRERILYETLLDMNRQRFNQSGVLEVLRLQMEQFPGEMELEEEYGLELITAQSYDEANAWFDSLAVEHKEPEFGRLAAHSWLYEENYESAESEYRKQLARWPDSQVMMGEFGRVLARNGKDEEAKSVLNSFYETCEDESLRYLYATLKQSDSDRKSIIEPLKETMYKGRTDWLMMKHSHEKVRIADSSELSGILIDMLRFVENRQKIVQAEAQIGLEDFRAAVPPLFQTATELKVAGEEIREMLETVRKHLRFDATDKILADALAIYPESALLLHHRGVLYYENGSLEPAKRFLMEAAELESNQKETHLFLGHIYRESGQFDQAILSFERVLSLDPENRQAYRSLIRIHQDNGKIEYLSSRWMQRYQHQKRNEMLREFLVEALHRADRFEEARALLK
ncbi:MAG: tetratricopeptide repeat protein [Balneolaceae bacterium]|nr:tetratricopeptide repeat protein [Balneolaceae bacterium]